VVSIVRPNQRDTETAADCHSEAYAAMLSALRRAEERNVRPSERYLLLCGKQAVYRLLKRPTDQLLADEDKANGDRSYAQAPNPAIASDFLLTYLPTLPEHQKHTVLRWAKGKTIAEIAVEDKTCKQTAWYRLNSGLEKLRGYYDN
jgi:DNA-directed RNA polymerase specialized sigma24 family protein